MNYFNNQFPERLEAELELADRLGIKPVTLEDREFDQMIQGTIKWAVTTDQALLIIPKFVRGQELSHAILTRGNPVLAAGEADIAGSQGQYLMLEINNHSGHFRPSTDSLELGKESFRNQGIDPLTA